MTDEQIDSMLNHILAGCIVAVMFLVTLMVVLLGGALVTGLWHIGLLWSLVVFLGVYGVGRLIHFVAISRTFKGWL